MDMLKQLSLAGLVPVIKVKRAEDAVPLCTALKNGGLPVAEITFRTEAAEEAIRLVHAALPDVLLGAGTVLTCEPRARAISFPPGSIPRWCAIAWKRAIPCCPAAPIPAISRPPFPWA